MTGTQRGGHSKGEVEMKWGSMVLWSVVLHLVIFSSLLFVPESHPITRRPYGAIIYEVDLVEMPAAGAEKSERGSVSKAKTAEAPVKPETKTRRIETAKKAEKPLVIAKKTVERPTTPVKKPEVSPSQLIDKAITKIEKRVQSEERSEGHVDRAISRLQGKVGDQEAAAAAPGPPGPAEGGRPIGGTAMQFYQMEVETWIKRNWSYPVAMDNPKDLQAVVVLSVKSDGAILETRFDKRSSSAIFDESVQKAIERSNPLPPFPESYRQHYDKDEIEINFNLKDLENL
ncbi:MAG: TonB C-terminal domain-containing protein [Desulfobacterales bacterium]|nr:TonB C-terminal domain-containing protein [Desulfobacterales bacterium]